MTARFPIDSESSAKSLNLRVLSALRCADLPGATFSLIVDSPARFAPVTSNGPSSVRLRFDTFEVDLRTGELWRHGIKIRLPEQSFRVLQVLIERPGEMVSRDELKQILWPADTFVDFDHGVNTAVKKIRGVLGDSSERPRYIETIPRRGYRFLASITEVPHATHSEGKTNANTSSAQE